MKKDILNQFKNSLVSKEMAKTIVGGYGPSGNCKRVDCEIGDYLLGSVSVDATCPNNGLAICKSFYPLATNHTCI